MKEYQGSCHCRNITFSVRMDVSKGIHKCNCTYCYKTKYQKVFTKAENLTLKSGILKDYKAAKSSWPEGTIFHYFCENCGVQVFSKGFLEMDHDIFDGWFYAVNLAAIDDVTPEEILAAPVIFEDGLHDKQMEEPSETSHL